MTGMAIITGCRSSCCWDWMLAVLTASLLLFDADCFLFIGSTVPCPRPATNCNQEFFNRVSENLGCLGCLMGCQPGYSMTANPRYYQESDEPRGHYDYHGIQITNTVNISHPQWICMEGDTCRTGFYSGKMHDQESCSWCGDGCARCSSFNNCERCFSGYSLNPHALPDGMKVVTCTHSNILCPSAPDKNCFHDLYVAEGIGCAGCQSCRQGYVVTHNPRYSVNVSAGLNGTYDYMGLKIHLGVNINEPRYICVAGNTCQDGWFGSMNGGTLICVECSKGCIECSSRNQCTKCADGYTLVQGSTATTSACLPAVS